MKLPVVVNVQYSYIRYYVTTVHVSSKVISNIFESWDEEEECRPGIPQISKAHGSFWKKVPQYLTLWADAI